METCMHSHKKSLMVWLIHFRRNHYHKNNWCVYPCGVAIHQCHRYLLFAVASGGPHLATMETLTVIIQVCSVILACIHFLFFPGTYYNKPKQFSTSCYLQIKVECSGSVRQSVILKPSQMDADACILREFLVVSQCFIILRSSGSDCCLHVKWPSVQMSHHSHRILTVRRTQSSSQIQGRHQQS